MYRWITWGVETTNGDGFGLGWYGFERDPVAALERTIGLVEETAGRHGIEHTS